MGWYLRWCFCTTDILQNGVEPSSLPVVATKPYEGIIGKSGNGVGLSHFRSVLKLTSSAQNIFRCGFLEVGT